ncbi:MAG: hypothetical protein H5T92_00460 [Synergistales bacterium]|nr:hypothetical protein [Synergistales bacterium]
MGLRERVRGKFPLFEKAEAAGVLATGNCLIVAPTGTGKSYIGRTILRNAALRGDPGVHVYLVPYRALAAEIYESFVRELAVEHGCEESVADGDAGTRGSFGDRGSSEDRGRSEERGSSGDRSGSEDRGTSGDRSNPEDRGSAEDRGALGVHSSARAQAEERGHSAARLDLPRLAPRVKIATGDHRDPFYPADTAILVATFERFSALLASPDLRLGRVVIDEVHLLADESRGPTLETLLVRLKTWKRPTSICALSAVISNPEHLAAWLGVPLVLGSPADRTVRVEFRCELAKDPAKRLESELEEVLAHGEQAIIFCRSKADSQKVATDLRPLVSRHLAAADMSALREAAARAAADDEEAEDLLELLAGGVAYHHAGLSRDARACVEEAFRNRHLKVISCTPTLAAGVNLPARLVVVKDIYRMEFIRGRPRRVVLSTGELLNMLGRAGRPGQVEAGRGLALVEPGLLDEDELEELQVAIGDARGNPVRSRLPDAFDSLMRFVLTVICDRGEATLQDAVDAVRASFWYHLEPQPIEFDKPLQADIMEDIPSFARVGSSIRLERAFPVPDGVAGSVASGDKLYNFSLTISGEDCTCEAKRKWRPRETCKHLACAIYTLLFGSAGPAGPVGPAGPAGPASPAIPAGSPDSTPGPDRGAAPAPPGVDEETRNRALYACAHRFRKTLDLGTKIQVALSILAAWGLIERVPGGGYRARGVGAIAAHSGLDLLLLRTARDRVLASAGTPTPSDVARWVAEDFFGDEAKRERWRQAVELWIKETPIKKIKLPEKFRGDFERGLEQLGELATVYGEIAKTLGNTGFAEACRQARGCLACGVAPELVPLAALRIPQLGRARCRVIYDQYLIKSLDDVAAADPARLTVSGVPQATVARWVETARAMAAAKRAIVRRAGEAADARSARPADTAPSGGGDVDEFLKAFGTDRLLFESSEDAAAAQGKPAPQRAEREGTRTVMKP